MKALDIDIHKAHLTNILTMIFKDNFLANKLAFKGGTAAMLFYKLPRFSTDLDFDLTGDIDGVYEKMTKLLAKSYKITDSSDKFYTLFWKVSYGTGLTNVKVEVSTRDNSSNKYSVNLLYGVNLKVMEAPDMVAHKLVAVTERKVTANRDLFDAHYFLSSPIGIEINYDVITTITGQEPKAFFQNLLKFVIKVEEKNILNGLGELLTESQKNWARTKLKSELMGLIERNIAILS